MPDDLYSKKTFVVFSHPHCGTTMKTNPKNLVRMAGVILNMLLVCGFMNRSHAQSTLKFISPIDGDMLCAYDGKITDGALLTTVTVSAPSGSRITINGIDAKPSGDKYIADIGLKDYRNEIEVVDAKTGNKQTITVFRLKNYDDKYRLSLDDNILFLKDISDHSARYKSIFENPYLGFLKEVHDTYGTKIHVNIYYQTEGFNLSQMTDKFRNEWRANSGWLRLSFHALQNKPDNPYIASGYDEVKKDCELVKAQILRFAGGEQFDHVTTLHWGAATLEGTRALRDGGYTALAGYFNVKAGQSPVSYYLDMDQRRHLSERFIWRDNKEGIIFSRIAIVINNFKLDKIVSQLNSLKVGTHKPGYIDLMIHEQYFHPDYVDYQPDFRQKVMTAVKWAAENGYTPAFLSECVFE
jgi:hypothetical protein